MARIWQTGFETGSLTNGIEFFGGTSGTIAINSTTKHGVGSYSARCNPTSSTGYFWHQISNNYPSVWYARMYIYIATAPSAQTLILGYGTSGGGIYLNNDRTLTMKDTGSGSVNSSAIPANSWHYVELCFNSGGAPYYTGRVDGTSFGTLSSLGAGSQHLVYFGIMSTCTADIYIDDCAVDGAAFPGAGAIVHLYPNASGSSNAWLTSGGSAGSSTNVNAVKEVIPNDATTYLKSTTVSTPSDMYNITDTGTAGIPSGSTINLVAMRGRFYSGSYSNNWAQWRLQINDGTSTTNGSYFNIDTSGAWRTFIQSSPPTGFDVGAELYLSTTKPSGGAWTTSVLDGTQIGVGGNVNTFSSEIRISQVYLLVEYLPSSVTTTSITKSLQYAIKAAPTAPTKSLKYTVKTTPSAKTKSLQYAIKKTQSAITKGLVYSVSSPITQHQITDSLKYTVKTHITLTKGLIYDVKTTPAALTKSLRYAARKSISQTKSLQYTTKAPVAITKSLKYTTKTTPAKITKLLHYTTGSSGTTGTYMTGASADDAKEASGTVTLTDTTVKIDGSVSVGFRIPGITIAQGATIGAATLSFEQMQAYSANAAALSNTTLYGEAADNSAQYTTASNNVTGRSHTTATATPLDNTSGIDVKSIVQEIVNRAGWSSGNALSFLFIGTGTAGSNYITPYMWDYFSGTYHAKLVVTVGSVTKGTTVIFVPLTYSTVAVTQHQITKSLQYTIKHGIAITKSLQYTIKKAAAAITKSLQYANRLSHSQTKSLTYDIKKSHAAITKSLQYAVKTTPAAKTKSLQYAIKRTPTALTKSLGYYVRRTLPITKSLQYATKAPVVKSLSLKYTTKTTHAAITKSLQYATKRGVPITKSLKYTVKTTHAAITKSLVYDIKRTPAAITKALGYYVRISHPVTKALGYNIRRSLPITKSLTYDTKRPVALTKSLKYTTKTTPAALTKSLKYVAGHNTVDITKTLQYTIKRPHAALTKALQYAVKKTPSAITKGLAYYARRSLNQTKTLQYEVKLSHAITKGLQYAIRRTLSKTKTLQYAVRRSPSLTKSLQYANRRSMQITKALKYTTHITPAGLTKALRYLVRTTHTLNKTLSYDIKRTPANLTKSLRYAVKTTHNPSKPLVYEVHTTPASITKPLAYRLITTHPIVKSLTYALELPPHTRPAALMQAAITQVELRQAAHEVFEQQEATTTLVNNQPEGVALSQQSTSTILR